MATRTLELLAPAANKEVAFQAILHGADAVYIGGPSHGARKKAANSVEDIAEVVEFAHRFRAKVYVTLNTLIYDHELSSVESLAWDMYRIGVDALIVQDMAFLEMNMPPIPLHASTQCDTRTLAKARFLEDVGFSQIVLARELSIPEIREIAHGVSVPVECFVHGALCVSYSGRCGASGVSLGRSANRGECAQMCRMPYDLINSKGEILEKGKYLLSLRDFNASRAIPDLIEAGVSSFKIEGRLKDAEYVKNVTAAYSALLNRFIASHPDKYRRASYGNVQLGFSPQLDKSFNRGFTPYFLAGRDKAKTMASLSTPKSMGEVIEDVNLLNNGDGVSFFNDRGEYEGIQVNGVSNGKIQARGAFRLPKGAVLHRTSDVQWRKMLSRPTAVRTLWLDMKMDIAGVSAVDERGVEVRISLDCTIESARKEMKPELILGKLGNTHYSLRNFENNLPPNSFIPASQLTALRRRLVLALDSANLASMPVELRRKQLSVNYFTNSLDARDNVANYLARKFWLSHGVENIEPAYELSCDKNAATKKRPPHSMKGKPVMTTRYCLRRELGCCLKDKNVDVAKRRRFEGPLSLVTGPHRFRLSFDCVACEMNLIAED